MAEYGVLYAAREADADASWFESRAEGATIERTPPSTCRAESFVLRWRDGELVVTRTLDDRHRDRMTSSMSADCERGIGESGIARRVAESKTVLFLETERGLVGPALAWVRARQRELEALLVWGDAVEDVGGTVRLTLPPEDDEPEPPDVGRVRRRAQILAAVFARAHLELIPPEQGRLADLWEWLDRHALWDEAERAELDFIRTDRGQVPQQAVLDGTWRSEGLVVLTWALRLHEMPPHDDQVDPSVVAHVVGPFADPLPATFLSSTLRSDEELAWMRRRLLGLHWRLRDFSLRPAAMDYRKFAADCWFGGFSLDGIPLVNGDLAIGNASIAGADATRRQIAHSIAMERHQAINWLSGLHRVYSLVDTST